MIGKRRLIEAYKKHYILEPAHELQTGYNIGWADALKAAGVPSDEIAEAQDEAHEVGKSSGMYGALAEDWTLAEG